MKEKEKEEKPEKMKSKQSECLTAMCSLDDDDDDQWTNERRSEWCQVENRLRPRHFRFDYSIYTNVKL